MHERNIEAAKSETLRLLAYMEQVLGEHLAAADLLRRASPDQVRRLDKEKAERWRKTIQREIEKVQNLETVLAVVGTAKAGKSMTINAIIGAEVLPSRPDPMTTLPTLVRHKRGLAEPVMTFPMAEDFVALAQAAREKIEAMEQDTNDSDSFLSFERHRKTAQRIVSGQLDLLKERYQGRKEIFSLLEEINDLCRLCSIFDLSLPADTSRASAAQLPAIEIEMSHVGSLDTGNGRFTILDSPGPNESGQGNRLREVVQEQLDQASALILVCDFTALRTDAEAEVQSFVEEVSSQLADRLFIFVNKFDQRSSRDWDDRQVRSHLSQTLLGGKIPPDRIFPVSARSAFRANWALRELRLHEQLPDPADEPMVEDFGQEALGKLWRRDIGDRERTLSAAEMLWKDSLFDQPLQQVIRIAAANAALISLKAAVAKVIEYGRTCDAFLKIRESATTTEAERIQAEIDALQDDIEKTRRTYDATLQRMDIIVANFAEVVGELCKTASKVVGKLLGKYFQTGTLNPAPPRKEARRSSRLLKAGRDVGQTFLAWLTKTEGNERSRVEGIVSQPNTSRDFEAGNRAHVLRGPDHVQEARALVRRIRERIQTVFLKTHDLTQGQLKEASEALAEQVLSNVQENLKEVLHDAHQRLKRSFNVNVDFPHPVLKPAQGAFVETDFDVIRSGLERQTRYTEESGSWASVKRFFGDIFGEMWGYSEIKEEREISTVDLHALRDQVMRQLGSLESDIRRQAEGFVKNDLRAAVDNYFRALEEYLDAFRGDLGDALQDKRLADNRLQALHSTITDLKANVEDLVADGGSLAQALGVS